MSGAALLDGLTDFDDHLAIPSKEEGSRPLTPLWGTQRYLDLELKIGLDEGIHYFLVLKGRQQGISTRIQALDLWWPQTYENMQGQVVVESDDTFASFRDVIREMQDSLPTAYRRSTFSDNDKMMVFRRDDGKRGSRLMYQVADTQRKKQGRLGRSRGLNYLHATEVGSWTDVAGIASLEASCAEKHPQRLYLWESTARGYNVWKDMWDAAEHAATQRRIFIGWWRREDYALERGSAAFARYGHDDPTASERLWMRGIFHEYEVLITPEQLAWYRYQLAEKFRFDETMLAQEHPCLPEDAFQAFGDKFIPDGVVRRFVQAQKAQPAPTALRFEWAGNLDDSSVVPCDPRTKVDGDAIGWIFEEPDPQGLYVIGARPARSSDPQSPVSVLEVFRVYPDRMEQVAEYVSDIDSVFQFAWAIVYFAGAYRMLGHPYLNVELSGPGRGVLTAVLDLQAAGRGLSPSLRARRGELLDLTGSITHYVFRRREMFQSRGTVMHWEDSPKWAPVLWNGLRDELVREVVDLRSPGLVTELRRVRRGEEGDSDLIGGGGMQEEGRAYAAALAVRCWLDMAIYDARIAVAPKQADPHAPTTAQQRLVQDFLGRLQTGPAQIVTR